MKIAVIIVLTIFVAVMLSILFIVSRIRDTNEDLEQEEFIKRYVNNIKE